jgi:hypothetical protein
MRRMGNPWDEYFAALGTPLRDIIGQFDSLGQNCEYGFIQAANHFGEGNLLTFALADSANAVIRLLEQRMEGLYTRDRLEQVGDGPLVRDRHYGIAFHSKMYVHKNLPTPEAERDAIYADDLGKLTYQTEKFRAQLSAPRRIWVYKSLNRIGLDKILELHGALAAYGPNRLLVVQEDPASPAGVEMLDQGLYLGHIPAYSPGGEAWRFDPQAWATVLRGTLRMAGQG